jgi:hypothetical protein
MIFEYSDAWLLQAIRLSEQDDKGATLTDIVKTGDFTNRSIFSYSELTSGTRKLKSIGLITERDKRLFTTEKLREWWTKKFEGKRKIGIHKGMDETLKYLNKTYATAEEQITKTEITKQDLDKSTREYSKLFWDEVKQLEKRKKVKS